MKVLVSINGREAIPVRAIPFLTDREVLVPDALVRVFAREDGRRRRDMKDLQAFYLDEGQVVPFEERAWLTVSADVLELEQRSAAEGWLNEKWREHALRTLPADAFVWKDEFVERFERTYGGGRVGTPNEPVEEHVGDVTLNFSPRIDGAEADLVREARSRLSRDHVPIHEEPTQAGKMTAGIPTPSTTGNTLANRPRTFWRALLRDNIHAIDDGERADVGSVITWLVKNGEGRIRPSTTDLQWKTDEGDWKTVKRDTVSTAVSAARKARISPRLHR